MTKDEVEQGIKLTRAIFLEPALAGSLSNPPSRALPSASDLGVWLWNPLPLVRWRQRPASRRKRHWARSAWERRQLLLFCSAWRRAPRETDGKELVCKK